jgi:SAM-dependent methyltransferase
LRGRRGPPLSLWGASRLDRAEYDKLDLAEDRMWWFAALHKNLQLVYRRLAESDAALPLLDAGCGTGGLLARIAAAHPEHTAFGLDADPFAAARAAVKSGCPVCAGSINALPFADAAFGAIISADVLCHRGVDEDGALAQFHRVLRDGGVLILNLPAYPWLLSRHDAAVANERRYTRRGIGRLLARSGFRLIFASYWNAVLLPVIVLSRKLLPGGGREGSDVRLYPAPVEALCRLATGLETALLRCGLSLPCGSSVIAVARKLAAPSLAARQS